MAQERILVYKDPEYDRWIRSYDFIKSDIVRLINGVKQLGVKPTTDILRTLLEGESIRHLVAKENMPDVFKKMPRSMQVAMESMFKKENEEDYMKAVGEAASKLQKVKDSGESLVNFSYFSVDDNGSVVLSPDYIKELESYFCVFVSTPTQHKVYEKWLEMKKVIEEFNQTVKEAKKREPTPEEKRSSHGYLPDYLQGFAEYGSFSLVTIVDDELILKGERFDCFV